MLNKKAQIPAIKVIAVLITVALFLISWVLILQLNISIDERKINTQLVTKQILGGNCFSDKYATFNNDKISKNSFQDCLNLNNNKNLAVRFNLAGHIYETKSNFDKQGKKCTISNTILCTELKYPVTYIKDNKSEIKELTLQVISK